MELTVRTITQTIFEAHGDIPSGIDEEHADLLREVKNILDFLRPANGVHAKLTPKHDKFFKHGDVPTQNEPASEGVKDVASSKTILDSGASCHIFNDLSWFDSYCPGAHVAWGGGGVIPIQLTGCGTISIELVDIEQNTHTLDLGHAKYRPAAKHNIISMKRLFDHNGIKGYWGNSISLINKEGVCMAKTSTKRGNTKSGLYILKVKPAQPKKTQERETDTYTTPENKSLASEKPRLLGQSEIVNLTNAGIAPENISLALEKARLLGQSAIANLTNAGIAPGNKSLASEKARLLGQSENVNPTNASTAPENKSLASEKARLLGQSENVNSTSASTRTTPKDKSLASEKARLLGQTESVYPTKAATDNAEKAVELGLLYHIP
ncbi:MAG: hypothetical protein M1822_006228 [Bathelium mastoideum]|nr:MAG: hypothetical protein M1822_006228 [Bathelium mastoideum]